MACACWRTIRAIPAGRRGARDPDAADPAMRGRRVPVIVTTSHFSSTVCVRQPARPGHGAAMVMVMPPIMARRSGSAKRRSTISTRPCPMLHSHHDPGCARGGAHVALPGAHGPRNRAGVVFQDGNGGAAAKLRELIQLGGEAIEGPWDGEEGITLLADAGATGSMTGGGYADGIRPIIDAHRAGPGSLCAVPGLASLINHENRQAGFWRPKALMKERHHPLRRAQASPGPPCIPKHVGACWISPAGWTRSCCAGPDNGPGERGIILLAAAALRMTAAQLIHFHHE